MNRRDIAYLKDRADNENYLAVSDQFVREMDRAKFFGNVAQQKALKEHYKPILEKMDDFIGIFDRPTPVKEEEADEEKEEDKKKEDVKDKSRARTTRKEMVEELGAKLGLDLALGKNAYVGPGSSILFEMADGNYRIYDRAKEKLRESMQSKPYGNVSLDAIEPIVVASALAAGGPAAAEKLLRKEIRQLSGQDNPDIDRKDLAHARYINGTFKPKGAVKEKADKEAMENFSRTIRKEVMDTMRQWASPTKTPQATPKKTAPDLPSPADSPVKAQIVSIEQRKRGQPVDYATFAKTEEKGKGRAKKGSGLKPHYKRVEMLAAARAAGNDSPILQAMLHNAIDEARKKKEISAAEAKRLKNIKPNP